ncbi:MAG TPA: LysR family transcriptional regulator [Polyangiaceae bacterium]
MSISQLDLNLLVVLDTVLAERSVVRAARRLHVTPSAVSNALARLRAALDDPLVARSGRGIVPTPRAAELAPTLARALRELDQAVTGGGFDPASTTREFTLAIADSGQLVRVPRLALLLGKEMPRARLRVVGIDTLLSSGGLGGSEVDVAIAALPEKAPGIHMIPLYREHTVLVARRDHPRVGARISKAELASLRHVDVEVAPGKGYRDLPASYARLGIERDVALVVPSFTAAAAIVAATDFVATVPASLVKVLGERFGIRAFVAPVGRLTVKIKLAWHERTDHDPAMRKFREVILRARPGHAHRY